MTSVTNEEKLREAARELKMRRSVYPLARSEQVPEAVLSIVLFRTNYGFEHSILFWVRASLTDVPKLLR